MNAEPGFLSVDDILTLHAIAIENQGGDPSIRDRGLQESAVATPAQRFGDRYLHEDIPAMAAAYAFHVCLNHPFIDGNKRAATAAMIAFLSDNGWTFDAPPDEAETAILQLAGGTLDKLSFTAWARARMREKPRMELRDFFNRIDPLVFGQRFLSLLPGETGANPGEFAQRSREAEGSMPFLVQFRREQDEAARTGDSQGWDRVTFLATGMLALHAIAEYMGYEW